MNVSVYDKALYEKIKAVFDNTIYATPDEAFKEVAEENNGQVKLPMISIYRTNYEPYFPELQGRVTRSPMLVQRSLDQIDALSGKALFVKIFYTIDIWATKRDHVDQIVKELIFFLGRNPKVTAHVNLDLDLGQIPKDQYFEAFITFEQLTDNSDLVEAEDFGRLYRNTLEISIDQAPLMVFKTSKLAVDIPFEFYEYGTKDTKLG